MIETITVANLSIDLIRKDIKNMHLTVHPPTGRIRLAVPEATPTEVIQFFAISKLAWMRKQIKSFENQTRETPRQYIDGESHYFMGKRYMLLVAEHPGHNKVGFKGVKYIQMQVKPATTLAQRKKLMNEWYRHHLKEAIAPLIEKWEAILQVNVVDWGVKQMRTQWGTCNPHDARVWFNLELAKKPTHCLEYVVAHELTHLHERHHNQRFRDYLDLHMPHWQHHRDELNALPLGSG